ncbi:MAG: hypothetical protein JNL01_02215 [Bdellovibrionales bacterium]|nr:hypothetical protein [Bdellovibrionales bacterium]
MKALLLPFAVLLSTQSSFAAKDLTETQRVMAELNGVDVTLTWLDQELDSSSASNCSEVMDSKLVRLEILMDRAEAKTEEGIAVLQSEKRLKRLRAKLKMKRIAGITKKMERKSERFKKISERCRYDSTMSAGDRLDLASRLVHLSLRQRTLSTRLEVLLRDYQR